MTEAATETIVITASENDARAIREGIDAIADTQASLSARRNLDGDVAIWIVIANVAVQALPHVLSFLKEQLASRKVKKIVFADGSEIENPTPQDLEMFRAERKGGKTTDDGSE